MTRVMLRKQEYSLQVSELLILDPSHMGTEVAHSILDLSLMTMEVCSITLLCLLLQKRVIFCSYSCVSWFTLPLFGEKWIKPVMNKSNLKITLLIITAATCKILSEVCQSNVWSTIQNKMYAARHSRFESQSNGIFVKSGILAKLGQPKSFELSRSSKSLWHPIKK